jgi:hypothetical protein
VLMQSFRSSCLFFSSSSLPPASTCIHLYDTPVTVNRFDNHIAHLTHVCVIHLNFNTLGVSSLSANRICTFSVAATLHRSLLNTQSNRNIQHLDLQYSCYEIGIGMANSVRHAAPLELAISCNTMLYYTDHETLRDVNRPDHPISID